jgi:hypothetical protein
MGKGVTGGERTINPEMTILDVLSRYRHTEAVFRQYDERIGECICCTALLEPLKNLAAKYDLNLDELLKELEGSAGAGK